MRALVFLREWEEQEEEQEEEEGCDMGAVRVRVLRLPAAPLCGVAPHSSRGSTHSCSVAPRISSRGGTLPTHSSKTTQAPPTKVSRYCTGAAGSRLCMLSSATVALRAGSPSCEGTPAS